MAYTGRKNLAIGEIQRAIAEAPRGATLKEISKSLGVTHQAILYHFKQYSDLEKYFDSRHSKELIYRDAIVGARKNATAIEIARKLGVTKYTFNESLSNHPKLRALYESLHCNTEKKITESTLEKITNAIMDAPKGTSLTKLQKEYGTPRISVYFKDFPELKELYVRIHGEPKKVNMRNFDKYTEISDAIKNAPQGSYISDIANSMNMDSGLFRVYMKNAPCLKIMYDAIHGKPAPKAKGISQGQIYETIEKMDNPSASKIARALNADKSSIYQRFRKYPLLKQFYDLKRK